MRQRLVQIDVGGLGFFARGHFAGFEDIDQLSEQLCVVMRLRGGEAGQVDIPFGLAVGMASEAIGLEEGCGGGSVLGESGAEGERRGDTGSDGRGDSAGEREHPT